MSLLGIDTGTTGCKAAVFSAAGRMLASAYEEYDFKAPQPGQAELDAPVVWERIKRVVARTVLEGGGVHPADPVSALSVSSMGEAMVPVSRDRRILGPSILNFDVRGQEYLESLKNRLTREKLYSISGNTLGNQYGLTKLMWMREHRPAIYEQADLLLNWGAFVGFMLGAEPAVDYSLANRSLLFDLDRREWSAELLRAAGLDRTKLPRAVPSGTPLGRVSPEIAAELGLPGSAAIVAGAHDQCANAVGCGVTRQGSAMFGMGTYLCIVPVFRGRPDVRRMLEIGLNTEHHALPESFVSFIYNMAGAIVKWFRETFAAEEHRQALARGEDVYTKLFAELPEEVSDVTVLPHFSPMGPPEFIENSSGVLTGLTLKTSRGQILKGILQGAVFSLKECVDLLPAAGIEIDGFRAVGGGSKSDAWVQLCADILDRPFVRPRITEAGALGAAILAGAGTGVFSSIEEGVEHLVVLDRTFEPDPARVQLYAQAFASYRRLWPLLKEFLTER